MPIRTPIDDQISATISRFAAELNQLVRKAALEAVSSALMGTSMGGDNGIKVRTVKTSAAPKAKGRKRGGKRTQEEVESLAKKFAAYVKAHPGQTKEAIGKGMGTNTKDLQLPGERAVELGLVHMDDPGKRRGAQWHPGSKGKAKAKPKAKKASKKAAPAASA